MTPVFATLARTAWKVIGAALVALGVWEQATADALEEPMSVVISASAELAGAVMIFLATRASLHAKVPESPEAQKIAQDVIAAGVMVPAKMTGVQSGPKDHAS